MPVRGDALLGRARHPPRGARRAPRGRPHRAAARASASTRGRSTTACSTATASCSANPSATATRAPTAYPPRCAKTVTDAELYAVTGLQQLPFNTVYQLVAELGTRRARGGRADAAAARPARLLADRRGRRRAHQRLDDRAVRRTHPASGRIDLAKRLGLPWAILPPLRDPGSVVGPLLPEVAGVRRPAGRAGHRGRLPRHRLGRRRRAGGRGRASPTSRPAPGRSSASSSTTRCCPRRPARPTSPTRAASTAPIRFLKNVMGLWVLSESVRTWADQRLTDATLPALLAGAADSPAAAHRRRHQRPAAAHARSSATDPMPDADPGAGPGGRRADPAHAGRDHPHDPRQPGARLPAQRPAGGLARRS